jgi:hypothetical protein
LKRVLRRLLALAAAIAACAAVAVTPAQAATFTILHANLGQEAHTCVAFGNDGTYQAVLCVDILTGWEADGSAYYGQGQVELLCEKGTQVVGCQQASVTAGLYNEGDTGWEGYSFECSQALGFNPCVGDGQRNYVLLNSIELTSTSPSCSADPNDPNALWTVAFGGAVFILPDGNYANFNNGNDDGNESTGHYFVCP